VSGLLAIPDLTVVTNSIPVEDAFYRGGRTDQTVVLIGGTRTVSDALVGPIAETALARVNFDVLFLGVYGMNPHAGFTTPNLAEADSSGPARLGPPVVVLADHTSGPDRHLTDRAADRGACHHRHRPRPGRPDTAAGPGLVS
jgi:DeoR/GlpR family transcriptional regulator of sugar metabolism